MSAPLARSRAALAGLVALATAGACTGEVTTAPAGAAEEAEVPGRAYLAHIAQILVSRNLTEAESLALAAAADAGEDPDAAIASIVTGWTLEPALADAARELVQLRLAVSGNRDGVNFELPGNLAAHTVADRLPWSTLLTAGYCVGDDLARIECDSGAPYAAGVLTTRAFLRGRASRFNLSRARTMMNAFACQEYPLADDVEPRITRERLQPMFQVDAPPEGGEGESNDFGNGFACYACHGQFSWHAQLFVQFDELGGFRADASGVQDPTGEPGRAVGGLFASHFAAPEEARSPASQMLGQPVASLVEAGAVLAASPLFTSCAARAVLEHGVGLEADAEVEGALIDEVTAALPAPGAATYADLVVAVFTHPRVIDAVTRSLASPSGALP